MNVIMKNIYNYQDKFEKRYKKIVTDNKELSEKDRELWIDFFDLLRSEGLSMGRRLKYVNQIEHLWIWHGKSFTVATIESLIKLAGIINDKDYTLATKKDYLNNVKKLYKTTTQLPKYKHLEHLYFWLYDARNKFYSTTLNYNKLKIKEDFLVEEDVQKILGATKTLRDKALITLLASQGTRPQEAFTIRKHDITFLENGLQIQLSGKTGLRTLFVYERYTVEAITRYLKTLRNDQDYLFDITPKQANNIVKDICKKVGISKRITLYKFRKFAVTQDRKHKVSNHTLEKKYGWVKGTKVIAHYDRTTPLDYMQEMQRKNGIISDEKPKSLFEDKVCLRCGEHNPYENEYCGKCTLKLNITKEELLKNKTDLERDVEIIKKELGDFRYILKRLFENDEIKKKVDNKYLL